MQTSFHSSVFFEKKLTNYEAKNPNLKWIFLHNKKKKKKRLYIKKIHVKKEKVQFIGTYNNALKKI